MSSTQFADETTLELELKLYRYLGIPVTQPAGRPQGIDRRFESAASSAIRELRRELFELRREASQIGRSRLITPPML